MKDLCSEYANPSKRPKFEPDSDTDGIDVDEKPFVNHPTLYIDDGNVILTTLGRTLFCVHWSLLYKHSPVFRELFEREHDSFRGLMQIPMEETPEELEALLGVIRWLVSPYFCLVHWRERLRFCANGDTLFHEPPPAPDEVG